jgi:hypothetical protein
MAYVYGLFDQNDDVFYVGKGTGGRMYDHENVARREGICSTNNYDLTNKIKNVINSGNEIGYKVFAEDVDEETAYEIEKEKINEIGLDNLCNLTKGGKGCRGIEKIREKQSKATKRRWENGDLDTCYAQEWQKNQEGETWEEIYGEEKSERMKKKMSEANSVSYEERYGERAEEEKRKRKEAIKKAYEEKSFRERVGEERWKRIQEKKSKAAKPAEEQPDYTVYEIKSPEDEVFVFGGRQKVKEYFSEYNEKNELKGPNRVSADGIIYGDGSSGWELVEKRKPNK